MKRLALCALACACAFAPSAQAEDAIAAAESLVRARYYEGLPYEDARALAVEAVPRLAEMLRDPGEVPHHANIVMALGISGHPEGAAALLAFAQTPPRGSVDAAGFNAQLALRLALGHQAAGDDRALAWLESAGRAGPPEPGWSYRSQRGERLARLLRRTALRGLAISGRPEAADRLRTELFPSDAVPPESRDPELSRHAADWLALHARVARLGPDGAFASRAAPRRSTR